VRLNRSLQLLDVSYNYLGPECASAIPPAVLRHPTLHSLNISGNSIGKNKGPHLIFALAGFPNGVKYAEEMHRFVQLIRSRQVQGLSTSETDIKAALLDVKAGAPVEATKSHTNPNTNPAAQFNQSLSSKSSASSKEKPAVTSKPRDADDFEGSGRAAPLVSFSVADNQLGPFCGYAIASMIERNKSLTQLDVAGNALGFGGKCVLQ
jgi:hypothetical protein